MYLRQNFKKVYINCVISVILEFPSLGEDAGFIINGKKEEEDVTMTTVLKQQLQRINMMRFLYRQGSKPLRH